MLLRKKLFVLSLALSSATAYATASVATLTNHGLVTIPALQPGFEFNLTALALKPAASNLNYVIYNKELPAQSPTWVEHEISPSYSLGFALGGRYIFSEGNDINLNWTHLSTNDGASTTTPSDSYFLGPDYEIGPAGIPIDSANGNAQFKYDVVNLDVGQFVDFGSHVETRFFGGLSTGFLREQVTTTYSGNTVGLFPGPFSTMQEVISKFTGIGPRFGIAASYNTNSNFSFLGEAGASALIGSSYSKTAYTSSAQELLALYGQTINNQFIQDQNVTQVVPGFDAKLGVSYKHLFSNNLLLMIKGGYQAAVYINAISQYIPASLVDGAPLETGGIFVATMSHTLSNYSVQGPFLEASLQL
jgi:hypothetical protein